MADEAAEVHEVRLREAAAVMAGLWFLAILTGVLLLHAAGPTARLDRVLFEVASALSNVGLSDGITGPQLPWFAKFGLIILMWAGRLEIVPVIVLFSALLMAVRRRLGHTSAKA